MEWRWRTSIWSLSIRKDGHWWRRGRRHALPARNGCELAPDRPMARYVSDRPIPVAGFNLGKYKVATARGRRCHSGNYATLGVERDFPSPPIQVVAPSPSDPTARRGTMIVPSRPSPAQNEATVAEAAAHAIQYYADRFGPYPYSHLALTQMPGRDSQGWPGLVFLVVLCVSRSARARTNAF